MTETIGWLWVAVCGMFGTCATGFFFLNHRLNKLSDNIDTAKNYERIVSEISSRVDILSGNIETTKYVAESIKRLADDVHEIKIFLKGDFKSPGLMHEFRDVKDNLSTLKEKVVLLEGKVN